MAISQEELAQQTSTCHELKTWPRPYQALLSGKKTFEFRKNDRGFEAGDVLLLKEWSLDTEYTGRKTKWRVTYVARGPDFGIPDNYVVMSVRPMSWWLQLLWSVRQ